MIASNSKVFVHDNEEDNDEDDGFNFKSGEIILVTWAP